MLFYLTTLHVSNVLTDPEPTAPYVEGQNIPTEAQMADYERAASLWNHNEYNCRNFLLNALDDSLYDIYSSFTSAREIWISLEKKYRTGVACSKKFVVGKFLNFKINDAKPVVKQVEELHIIVHELEVEGMGINSNFLVGSIIEKLPQSWKNFKLYLKHLTDEKADANSIEPNANIVVHQFGVMTCSCDESLVRKGGQKQVGEKWSESGHLVLEFLVAISSKRRLAHEIQFYLQNPNEMLPIFLSEVVISYKKVKKKTSPVDQQTYIPTTQSDFTFYMFIPSSVHNNS
ncbi:hypothetical protein CTI12_AA499090 [Artemisia annua]|uniref:Zinc finger, CCHC-type n=1 Tax=Artemisia annua TaxID=35608 RepID=A0A2U1LEP1_ARTAN|nr:hypothetical protein CTI12_AA499090 [Artemisia annua]